jgi:hypothetical protein
MRFALVLGAGCLGLACASSHAVVSASAATPTLATTTPPPPRATRPAAPAPAQAPARRDHTLAVDELPPNFAELSPRDREQWHACHIFFLGDRQTGAAPSRYEPRPGEVYRPPASQHLGFRVTPTDYVAVPEAERRGWLVRNGCPDSLVELADGTHLDMIHP